MRKQRLVAAERDAGAGCRSQVAVALADRQAWRHVVPDVAIAIGNGNGNIATTLFAASILRDWIGE